MSDFQESKNFCGRYIEYPSFGDVNGEHGYAGNVRSLFPTVRNVILPPPETPHPNVPPGVTVRPSACQTYYTSRDPRSMSNPCKSCLYNEYDVTRVPAKGQDLTSYNCVCNLDRNFTPDSFCDYAQCVQTQYNSNGSCQRPFNAIFNQDDIRDAAYLPPFTYEQMDYCLARK